MAILNQSWAAPVDSKLPLALTNGTLHVGPSGARLFYVGGTSNAATTGTPDVYTAQIQGDGSLAPWRLSGSLPKGFAFHSSAMVGDWLYVLNGTTISPTNPLYAVRIDSEGKFVGTAKEVGSMDVSLSSPVIVVDGQWMFVIGGNDAAATVIATGNLSRTGTTVTATIATGHNFVPGQTVTLAAGEADFAAGVKTIVSVPTPATFTYTEAGNAVVSTGPQTFTAIANPRVRSVRLNGDGTIGNWQLLSESQLPIQNYFSAGCIWNGFIYIFGGADNLPASAQTAIYSAPIVGNGRLGRWTRVGDLPVAVSKHALVQFRDKVLVLGGQDATSTNRDEIWTAALQPSGGIGPFSTDALRMPVAIRNVRAVTDNKRIFMTSGFTSVRIDDMYVLRLE